jgi:hypothetical protein
MEKAIRLRVGDYVKGMDDDIWAVGRITLRELGAVEIEDINGGTYTLEIEETYKATKAEYEEYGLTPDAEEDTQETQEALPNTNIGTDGPKRKGDTKKNAGDIVSGVDTLAEILAEELADPETDPETDPEEGEKHHSEMSSALNKARRQYDTYVRPTGKKSVDNGDEVAALLRSAKDMQEACKIAADILSKATEDIWDAIELLQRYSHLNPGHQRMCIGNLVRGKVKKFGVNLAEIL